MAALGGPPRALLVRSQGRRGMRLPIVAALLLLSPAAGLHLLGTPKQPQRGHRVSPEYCEDLPRSWAKEAKLAQLDGRVPTAHGDLLIATFACGCYWGPELAFQRTPGRLGSPGLQSRTSRAQAIFRSYDEEGPEYV